MTLPDPDRHPETYSGLGVILLVGGLALANWLTLLLAPVGLALCVVSTYSRQHGWLLLGPLAGWELTRTARRGRLFVYRVLIVVVALFYLSMVFSSFLPGRWYQVFTAPGTSITTWKAARAGGEVFGAFGVCTALFVSASVIVGLSPVIAEERERNRLDHLLVTDLRSREILLGKMIARLGVTAGYVLLIVPVLALMTTLGGIDPTDAAVFGTVALLALFGLTGCALMATTETSAKSGGSVLACVGAGGLYLFGTVLLRGVSEHLSAHQWLPPVTDRVAAVCKFLADGNPGVALAELLNRKGGGGGRDPVTVLCHYAAGQFLWFAVGLAAAADSLRQELKPATAATAPKPVVPWPQKPKEPVSDEPVRWQEVEYNTTRGFILSGWRRKLEVVVGWCGAALLVAAVVALIVCGWFFPETRTGLTTLFACTGGFGLVIVTLPTLWIASRGIAREWEKDTLEALRITALTPADILAQKWRAALDLTRPPLYIGFACVGLGVVSTAMPVVAAAVTAGMMTANWYVAASVGVWIAVRCRKTAHAGWQFVVVLACVYMASMVWAGVLSANQTAGLLGLATVPPVAEVMSGVLAVPRPSPNSFGPRNVVPYPSSYLMAAAVVVAFVSCWLWSRLAWRSACRRFTRDMTPAPDGPPP